MGRTPPGVRELKHFSQAPTIGMLRRTPPGVRELKQREKGVRLDNQLSRTPPGVRELKHPMSRYALDTLCVAPLPGCVN